MNQAQYRAAFIESLKQFPLYQSSHYVRVSSIGEDRWDVEYAGIDADRFWLLHPFARREGTHVAMNIQTEGGIRICDGLHLSIHPAFRYTGKRLHGRSGMGTKLLECVEDFARNVGCEVRRCNPGESLAGRLEFHAHRGYARASEAFKRQCPTTGNSLIKRL